MLSVTQLAACKAGENDVTIILKPFPGAKRWQHLQRQQGPAGGAQFAVEQNYTVILGSHRNSKLKIEKNGEERESVRNKSSCHGKQPASSSLPPQLQKQQAISCLHAHSDVKLRNAGHSASCCTPSLLRIRTPTPSALY